MDNGKTLVGCCGFQKSQAVYYQNFPLIEIQQTFYKPPMLKTAQRWRSQAPDNFIFTIKAWQLITHEPYSPTYQRSGLDLSRSDWERYGSFRPTMEVFEAWERTYQIAEALNCPLVLFQCPPQFTPKEEHLENMRAFFLRARRDDLLFAWEPRGEWPDEVIGQLCAELDLIHCVDPFLRDTMTKNLTYARMHGGPSYTHQFTGQELEELNVWAGLHPPGYYLFNNVTMWEDAGRFQRILAGEGDQTTWEEVDMVTPKKPDSEAGSEQADNIFNSTPHDLPDHARAVYEQAYAAFVADKGNLPEEAHHAAMAAVMKRFTKKADGEWQPQDPSDLTAR